MQNSTVRIAWRNLWRSRRRTLLALLAVAVGQAALLATQGIMRGYGDNIQRAVTGPMIGHIQVHAEGYREKRAMDLSLASVADKLAGISEAPKVSSAAPRLYAGALMAPQRDAYVATVLGVDVERESRPFGMLSQCEQRLESGEVFIGYRLARRSGAKAGDEIALVGNAADGSLANDLFVVREVLRSPVDVVNQSGVVMRIEHARDFFVMPDGAHEIVVRTDTLDDVDEALASLRSMPALAGLEIAPWDELVPEFKLIIEMCDKAGWFVLGLLLLAAAAGIANTLMMATYERMHEFGMLLALGCRPRRIVRLILVEAVFLGLLGAAIGTAIGGAFIAATQGSGIDMASWGGEAVEDLAYMGLRMPLEIVPRIEWFDPAMGFVAVVIVALVAAAWPALVAARLDPMEAMRS